MGNFSKGPNEEDLAISMSSDRTLDDEDICQTLMVVY
jgi:hypothetical protein